MSSDPHRPAAVGARVAEQDDTPAVTETIALAFNLDPVWSWAFPDVERRLEQHRAIWRLVAESSVSYGWAWLAEGCAAAALWIPPGRPELRPEDEERIGPLLEELMGDGAARVLDTFERFEAAHPDDRDHFYLSLLGTHPDRRGGGIGMGLLAETLARIDAQGSPAFLESSNPANDRRYEGLGFRPCGEFELGEDGPSVTQMWRDPR
jgi:GNAT superfamily N-acetyltransferase